MSWPQGDDTNTVAAIRRAIDELATNGRDDAAQVCVLVSDGGTDYSNPVVIEAVSVRLVSIGTRVRHADILSLSIHRNGLTRNCCKLENIHVTT